MESQATSIFSQSSKQSQAFSMSPPSKESVPKLPLPEADPWSTKTPDKPVQLPSRAKNRGVALSLKEVRQAARNLQKPHKRSSHSSVVDGISSSLDSTLASPKCEAHTKLPEKYENLMEFFSCLESSIRLLGLKRLRSNFMNICPQIEALTDRRFSYGHLAQMKYILPEAINIEKISMVDERTLCVKTDLLVTLQLDAFESQRKKKMESGYLILKKAFQAKLMDFFKTYPERDEIPEAALPEPFNKRTQVENLSSTDIKEETLSNRFSPVKSNLSSSNISSYGSLLPTSSETLVRPSHLPPSFQRRFSQKIMPESGPSVSPQRPIDTSIKTRQPSTVSIESIIKYPAKPPISKKSFIFSPSESQLPPSSTIRNHHETTESEDFSQIEEDCIVRTSVKPTSTPSRLFTMTPEVQTPKRCRMSPDDDFSSPNKSLSQPTSAIRSLKFHTPSKNTKSEAEENESEMSADAAIFKILPKSLLQSITEKEQKAMEDRLAGVTEAKRRKKMVACLPKLFDMVYLIFQSVNRSVMTKQELMHKIIMNNHDIVDKDETEEQLKLLQELVPDWITGKVSFSGDSLFCINKTSSPESIHARLAEAE